MGYAPPNSGLGGRKKQREFDYQRREAIRKQREKEEARRKWREGRDAALAKEAARKEAKKAAKEK